MEEYNTFSFLENIRHALADPSLQDHDIQQHLLCAIFKHLSSHAKNKRLSQCTPPDYLQLNTREYTSLKAFLKSAMSLYK